MKISIKHRNSSRLKLYVCDVFLEICLSPSSLSKGRFAPYKYLAVQTALVLSVQVLRHLVSDTSTDQPDTMDLNGIPVAVLVHLQDTFEEVKRQHVPEAVSPMIYGCHRSSLFGRRLFQLKLFVDK